MTAASPVVKGWCPGLYAPMQAADGWLVRVRPSLNRISAAQARSIAQEAEGYGNGIITLTNRANLQLRGFSHTDTQGFPGRMIAAGLGLPDAGQEKRQNLLVSPLMRDDPTCAETTAHVADRMQQGLRQTEALSALPDKFGFAVDGGGFFPVGSLSADIMLQAGAGADMWRVVCGSARSEDLPSVAAVNLALFLATRFVALGLTKRPLRAASIGPDLFAESGIVHHALLPQPLWQQKPIVSVGPLIGASAGAYGVGVPLGQMTPAMLQACAWAAEQGDGIIRLTPWHTMVLAGQQDTAWRETLANEGLVITPNDARLRVKACSGVAGCAQAVADVGAQALDLARFVPPGRVLHVSGCHKGCAYPKPAWVTVVAGLHHSALVRNGCAGDEPLCYLPDNTAVSAQMQLWAKEEGA